MSDECNESYESKNEVEGEIGLTVGGKVGGRQVKDVGKAKQGPSKAQEAEQSKGQGRGQGGEKERSQTNSLLTFSTLTCAQHLTQPNQTKPKHAEAPLFEFIIPPD